MIRWGRHFKTHFPKKTRNLKEETKKATLPLGSEKTTMLGSGGDGKKGKQAGPTDAGGQTTAEAVDRKIDLVHVLHHLPELLGLHQSGGRGHVC